MHNYHFWGMHLFWWVMLFLILVVFVFFDVSPKGKKRNPLRTLKQRLAAGEITMEEYHQLKEVLEEDYKASRRSAGKQNGSTSLNEKE